ncbi:pyridoxamine 5'-phosphate oxidase family protein [Clostridium saccharobutylicum]|uniref:Pyridoxamine 5'-phosphate oxidase family protein n=1 Tax=Clostridium saccharobutylicum DSM 13864 TaxID=1345695 RepID=U5MX31_CLOSA|nr:pyridoxamine 5'-phosphate oxidase family protein [Clostridium saccharobutylicum]AGX45354.1 pyridoxamine 5'-phosphate oxidase family protein [Clostridium saccharobutylicum DSM 13864]AQR92629.1 pyridoxamine 5'-phosphate oxidase [Clostridium saccharobutylicum]AQS02531.1 pyridoxamine 5'-phosphate oxidase [Clostridium saccharobutylicum]AQS12136.1 pyridoxamine 5'-phosphate oxidase [Clostridium saccharobutylicum]AQS16514.1 pyridoxamine 5'-phosphate oxidase [Clostridium saccharobutylicum]
MDKALEFLKDCGTFYLATNEGDQPRVRPFGAVFEYEHKLYIVTNNTKKCFKQMLQNPKVEISGMNKKGQWIRLSGEVANDDRREVKELALETIPVLKSMYNINDGIFAVLYFTKGTATISSFTGEPETFSL